MTRLHAELRKLFRKVHIELIYSLLLCRKIRDHDVVKKELKKEVGGSSFKPLNFLRWSFVKLQPE